MKSKQKILFRSGLLEKRHLSPSLNLDLMLMNLRVVSYDDQTNYNQNHPACMMYASNQSNKLHDWSLEKQSVRNTIANRTKRGYKIRVIT